MNMEIKTVKATGVINDVFYLYHGGPLRSHVLYADAEDLPEVHFKHLQYSDREMQSEMLRVRIINLSGRWNYDDRR